MVRGSRLALAAIFIAAFMAVAPARAHYRTTGDDVITASPKVRAQLDELRAKAISVSATEASTVSAVLASLPRISVRP